MDSDLATIVKVFTDTDEDEALDGNLVEDAAESDEMLAEDAPTSVSSNVAGATPPLGRTVKRMRTTCSS